MTKPGSNLVKTVTGAGAAKDAADELTAQANKTAAAYKPFAQMGQEAMGRISDILSGKQKVNLQDIPGYQAGLDAGTSTIERSSLAKGAVGGGTLASLFGFGQSYAGKAFSDYMTQLGSVANTGMAALGSQLNAQQQGAQAQAAYHIAHGNAISDLIKTGVGFAVGGPAGGAAGLFSGGGAGTSVSSMLGTPSGGSFGSGMSMPSGWSNQNLGFQF